MSSMTEAEQQAIANSRIQVRNNAPALPGKCVVCGTPGDIEDPDRTFIDFGFDLDDYGTVYFCSTCMNQIANALGYISDSEWAKLQVRSLELQDEITVLENERNAATNALRTYLNGTGGVGARSESEELPQPVSPIKRTATKKPAPKSAVGSNAKDSGPDDTGDGNGDTISLF